MDQKEFTLKMERNKALNLMNFEEQKEYRKLSNEAIALKLAWSYGINEEVQED